MMQYRKLEDKVALVTGASSGIGRATAVKMAQEGATVVIASRREAENERTLQTIREAGADGFYQIVDVTQEDQVKSLIDEIISRYGRLNCAFNNAGTIGAFAPLVEQSLDDFEQTFAVNVRGVWLCMKYQALAMQKHGGGAIVNCSSWLSPGAFPLSLILKA